MTDNAGPGRPTDYRPEYAEDLITYFNVKPYEKLGDRLEINDFPTLAGFAIRVGVHRDTLHEWSKQHPEFSDAYKRAKDFQENYLVINGLRGLVNSNFGQFTAKNVLGWRDKQPGEADVVVNNNVQALTDEEIDKRYAAAEEKIRQELLQKLEVEKEKVNEEPVGST